MLPPGRSAAGQGESVDVLGPLFQNRAGGFQTDSQGVIADDVPARRRRGNPERRERAGTRKVQCHVLALPVARRWCSGSRERSGKERRAGRDLRSGLPEGPCPAPEGPGFWFQFTRRWGDRSGNVVSGRGGSGSRRQAHGESDRSGIRRVRTARRPMEVTPAAAFVIRLILLCVGMEKRGVRPSAPLGPSTVSEGPTSCTASPGGWTRTSPPASCSTSWARTPPCPPRPTRHRVRFHSATGSLRLSDFTQSDRGLYQITVTAVDGAEAKAQAQVAVYEPVAGIDVSVSPNRTSPGQNLTLSCSVSGGSDLRFFWTKESRNVTERAWPVPRDLGQDLVLSVLSWADCGTYTCTAWNLLNRQTRSINLTASSDLPQCQIPDSPGVRIRLLVLAPVLLCFLLLVGSLAFSLRVGLKSLQKARTKK
ncbi:uncharacterized protein LOC127587144 [Pristis pectinata]|uniref:uncharacterized protein LOC127587144 n=1 Tax=Pristis pectinata TaxID=685728 RepID=UPI00223CF8DE|nr:uncharacterized protein LOC127587144 [Pristis pectinata]